MINRNKIKKQITSTSYLSFVFAFQVLKQIGTTDTIADHHQNQCHVRHNTSDDFPRKTDGSDTSSTFRFGGLKHMRWHWMSTAARHYVRLANTATVEIGNIFACSCLIDKLFRSTDWWIDIFAVLRFGCLKFVTYRTVLLKERNIDFPSARENVKSIPNVNVGALNVQLIKNQLIIIFSPNTLLIFLMSYTVYSDSKEETNLIVCDSTQYVFQL